MINRTQLNGKWPRVELGEVVEFLDHLRKPVTAKDREPGPYPYYGANGQQDSVADFIFDEPLVLVAEDGGHFGEEDKPIAYQIEGKTWVNNHAHVLRPTKRIDIRFLCRHLENYDVRPFTSGTTRLKLNKAKAARIPIALPPLSEQKRIAEILDRAESLRRQRRAALALLDELTQSIFLDMFGDPVSNPMGWEWAKLKDVLDLITYGLTVRPKYVSNGIPLISGKEIRTGIIDFENAAKISQKDFDSLSEKAKPAKSDLLFSKTGSIGHTAIVATQSSFALAQNVARLTFNPTLVNQTYALFYLRSGSIQALAKRSVRGNAVKDLQLGVMGDFPFALPPVNLQQKFADRIEALHAICEACNEAKDNCDQLFASLQHRAFRGEL